VPSSREAAKSSKRLGDHIRRKRMEKGLTQQRLGELCNVDIRNIQRIEAGEINVLLATFNRIRKALGCSWDDAVPKDW